MAGEPPGEYGFPQLTAQAALAALCRIEQQIAGYLLGDGAASGEGLTAAQVDPQGAQNAGRVDARIGVKAAVLCSDRSLAQGDWEDCSGKTTCRPPFSDNTS